jgi:hypothetical protein
MTGGRRCGHKSAKMQGQCHNRCKDRARAMRDKQEEVEATVANHVIMV